MSKRWECPACGAMVPPTQKWNHVHWQCPMQGQGRKKREAAERKAAGLDKAPEPEFWQYLACVCGCGAQIGQVKGQKKRQFVDHGHYDKWRAESLRTAAGGEADLVAKRKHAEEVAALAAKEEAIAREAAAVRLLTPDKSLQLWAQCLGFSLDAEHVAA